jgi:hypothetical protein
MSSFGMNALGIDVNGVDLMPGAAEHARTFSA